MAPAVKIAGSKRCPHVQAILAAADLVGVRAEFTERENGLLFGTTSGEEYENDAATALRYIGGLRADVPLLGRNYKDQTDVDYWFSVAEKDFWVVLSATRAWKNIGGDISLLKRNFVDAGLKAKLEPHVAHNTYLAGERLSIADILLAFIIRAAEKEFEGSDLLENLPSTKRWYDLIMNNSSVKKQITSAAAKPARAEKVAPKPAPAKPTPDTTADDEDKPKKEKKTNPLDTLPASKFDLDEWKREYSNSKDLKGAAMPWFWEHLDTEGWSLWFMRYDKLEGENKVGYTTANMLNGFIQVIDGNFRKYSFAVVNVVGEAGDFDIQGVWLIRGQELPEELTSHRSFEYHTFRKLDPQTDRSLVTDYWCNDDKIGGRPIDSCKVWK